MRASRDAEPVEQAKIGGLLGEQPVRSPIEERKDRLAAPPVAGLPHLCCREVQGLVPRDPLEVPPTLRSHAHRGMEHPVLPIHQLGKTSDLGADVPLGQRIAMGAVDLHDAPVLDPHLEAPGVGAVQRAGGGQDLDGGEEGLGHGDNCTRGTATLPLMPLLLLVLLLLALPASAATLPADFTETLVAKGIVRPTAMALAPDGRIFVCEQTGALRVIKDGKLLPDPFVKVPVFTEGERGLLGVTVDPDFADDAARLCLLHGYHADRPQPGEPVHRRGRPGGPGERDRLLDLPQLAKPIHNGGAMHFGPDGKLYIAVGENAVPENAQNLDNLLGKILRIDKDGSIPSDNPSSQPPARAIWAYGLRNPVHLRVPARDRTDVHQRRGQEHLGGDQRGRGRRQLRLAAHRGPDDRPALPGARSTPTGTARPRPRAAPSPAGPSTTPRSRSSPPNTWGATSSPTSAAAGSAASIPRPGPPMPSPQASADPSVSRWERTAASTTWPTRKERSRASTYTGSPAPRITAQPEDITVTLGAPATFTVGASGEPPLRTSGGATGPTCPEPPGRPTPSGDGAGRRRRDLRRGRLQRPWQRHERSGNPDRRDGPAARGPDHLSRPRPPLPGRPDDHLRRRRVDPEDGPLPPSSLTWRIDFHHAAHSHPFVPDTPGHRRARSRSPRSERPHPTSGTASISRRRDSEGLTGTTSIDVLPRKVKLTFLTDPPGLQILLDGEPRTTPFMEEAVVGLLRTIGAAPQQSYEPVSWSDGGAPAHEITTPSTDTTYTAVFRAIATQRGLMATYFRDRNLSQPVLTRIDPNVDFDWGQGPPAPGIGKDTFSIRWTGKVEAKVSGPHTFLIRADNGARLWVGGKLLIDVWQGQAQNRGTVQLEAGKRYDLRLEYYENRGSALVQLLWSAPGLRRQVIPQGQLAP